MLHENRTAKRETPRLPKRESITIDSALDSLRKEYKLKKHSDGDGKVWDALRSLSKAFGSLENVKDKRILDIGCGCNGKAIEAELSLAYRTFEPWFCRAVHFLGGQAFGVDWGFLEGEKFEYKSLNLMRHGSLDFLPDQSFDAINSTLLFSSHQLHKMKRNEEEITLFVSEMERQKERLLKPDGIIIKFDTDTDNR